MIPDWARKAFGGKSDDALQRMAEREDARREVENTRWYRLVNERLETELKWTESELRRVSLYNFERLQAYGDALEIVLGFIRASKLDGKLAGELLSERMSKKKPESVDDYMEKIFGVNQ